MVGRRGRLRRGRRVWERARRAAAAAVLLCFAFLPVAYCADRGDRRGDARSRCALVAAVRSPTGARRPAARTSCSPARARGWRRLQVHRRARAPARCSLAVACARARGDRAALGAGRAGGRGGGARLLRHHALPLPRLRHGRAPARAQAETAGDFAKLGQDGRLGLALLPRLAALGPRLAGRRSRRSPGAVLVCAARPRSAPLLLALFPRRAVRLPGLQSRYFGRWLLPAYPVLALLARLALARVRPSSCRRARRLGARSRWPCCSRVVLAQPLAADMRTGAPARAARTRASMARDFLAETTCAGLRVVIEPAVPARWYRLRRPRRRSPATRKQFVRGFAARHRARRAWTTRPRSRRRRSTATAGSGSAWW